jgi:small subunit ribosomal protein S16
MRLRRVGAKKQPSYRVVIADRQAPRDGRFIEIVGHYNPRTEPTEIVFNAERCLHWLRQGAQPSDRVQRLLVRAGIWEQFSGEAPAAAAVAATTAPADDETE